jgi:type IV secretion system protein TrbC
MTLFKRGAWKRLQPRVHNAIFAAFAANLVIRPYPTMSGNAALDLLLGPVTKLSAAVVLVVLLLTFLRKHPAVPGTRVSFAGPTTIGILALLSFGNAWAAFAAGSGMPWEEPLQQVLESVQGPVAKIVAVIIIITTGLTLAFGETAGGFRRLIQIVFGLSIAFAASSFFLSFFSFGGGALIA